MSGSWGSGVSFGAAAVATWLLCEAWQAAVPRRGGDLRSHLVRRTILLLGRMAIVLGVITVGVARGTTAAPAIVTGAILGWLAAAAREFERTRAAGAGTSDSGGAAG